MPMANRRLGPDVNLSMSMGLVNIRRRSFRGHLQLLTRRNLARQVVFKFVAAGRDKYQPEERHFAFVNPGFTFPERSRREPLIMRRRGREQTTHGYTHRL